MKVLGIVAEYNPFHNGHAYHLARSLDVLGDCVVVCVMSGNFIQRGEPALLDKWARAEAALLCGIDLVIELPVIYAMASAEYFALGAVKLLDSLGVVEHISFGSETGNIAALNKAAELFHKEPGEYKAILKGYLDSGMSYPSSRSKAACVYLEEKDPDTSEYSTILGSSNNILGVEYLKALKKLNSSISPITIKREGSSYNSKRVESSFPSATAVRQCLRSGHIESLDVFLSGKLPKPVANIMKREFSTGRGPVFPEDFENMILSKLRNSSPKEISLLPYVSEGLENRIYEAAFSSGSISELYDLICTKRYPRTRIQRTLFHLLSGLTGEKFNKFNEAGGPGYIRVLGFNSKGRALLSKAKDIAKLPLVTKTSDFINSGDALSVSMLRIEATATDNYVLGFKSPRERLGNQEFTHSPVVVE